MQDNPKTGKSGFRYECYKHAHSIDDAYANALAADVDAWEDFLSEIALDRKPLINYNEFGVRTTRENQ
jgi:hypothetical protein